MKKYLNIFAYALMVVLTLGAVACGDDDKDDEPGGGGGGMVSGIGLTIDGSKWSNPVITVFDNSYGSCYFTYMAFDTSNGNRKFTFNVDQQELEAGNDIAEEIEITALGNAEDISLVDKETEYISGSVMVESSNSRSITLDFRNYQCYYYPRQQEPAAKYKHTFSGKVTFTLDGE